MCVHMHTHSQVHGRPCTHIHTRCLVSQMENPWEAEGSKETPWETELARISRSTVLMTADSGDPPAEEASKKCGESRERDLLGATQEQPPGPASTQMKRGGHMLGANNDRCGLCPGAWHAASQTPGTSCATGGSPLSGSHPFPAHQSSGRAWPSARGWEGRGAEHRSGEGSAALLQAARPSSGFHPHPTLHTGFHGAGRTCTL